MVTWRLVDWDAEFGVTDRSDVALLVTLKPCGPETANSPPVTRVTIRQPRYVVLLTVTFAVREVEVMFLSGRLTWTPSPKLAKVVASKWVLVPVTTTSSVDPCAPPVGRMLLNESPGDAATMKAPVSEAFSVPLVTVMSRAPTVAPAATVTVAFSRPDEVALLTVAVTPVPLKEMVEVLLKCV